jgi:hypothetical protein
MCRKIIHKEALGNTLDHLPANPRAANRRVPPPGAALCTAALTTVVAAAAAALGGMPKASGMASSATSWTVRRAE